MSKVSNHKREHYSFDAFACRKAQEFVQNSNDNIKEELEL